MEDIDLDKEITFKLTMREFLVLAMGQLPEAMQKQVMEMIEKECVKMPE